MQVIHDDLHCNAVRITGGYPDRLEVAAKYAAEAGLGVWFCPFTNNLTSNEMLDLLADCAERAERLRRLGAEVVLLAGSELGLMNSGFLPGDSLQDRMAVLAEPQRVRALIPGVRAGVNAFLGQAVEVVRSRFGGKLSYASLPFEAVDWRPFDIIATDAGYRAAEAAARFRDDIRAFVAQGKALRKAVAITEFGCATYRGAADLGARDDSMIEWGDGAQAVRLKGDFTRDEDGQARYIAELLDIFETEGVDNAFVYTFARYDLPHRSYPSYLDLDLASGGVVKVLDGRQGRRYPDMPWEPEAAFMTLAEIYGR